MRRSHVLIAYIAIATAAACRNYHESDYSPTAPSTLTLSTIGDSTAPADGVSRIHVVARITSEAATDKRTIVFSASAGILVGGTGTSDTERSVDVDLHGEAQIDLQAPSVAQSVLVGAHVKDQPIAQQLTLTFTPVSPAAVIQFVNPPTSAPADGATQSLFTVYVPNFQSLAAAARSVTFTTTTGKVLPDGSAVNLDSNGRATVAIQSSDAPGTAVVRATVGVTANTQLGGATANTQIEFVPALPDFVDVSPDKFAVEARLTDSVVIHAKLRRRIGKVSAGIVVSFQAVTAAGTSIGLFRDQQITTDGTNDPSATYTPGDTSYRGPVTISVEIEGSTVRGTATVQVIDPSGGT